MIRKTCHFAGHVQGVGFRYTAQNIAAKAGLSGYVRNLPDGRVEVVMEGDEPEINRALDDIQRQMSAYIRKTHIEPSLATGEFTEFSIRH